MFVVATVRLRPAPVVRTGPQELYLKSLNTVAARCTAPSFENAYVFRTFRLQRPRSVPLWRSTKHAFTTRLTADDANADATAPAVPNTTRVLTRTTRLFSRSLYTVAYVTSGGTVVYGLRGRPRRPVRGGVTRCP